MPWPSIGFEEAIRKTPVGRDNQILSADIKQAGRFPVVDQGQAFIAGYSDAEERVIRDDLPLVIFGDHTRCLKFVDFPFILGADGTKVLKPKEDLFDAEFFFYALLSLDIPNRGYNRHFTLLKEKNVPHPERGEQRKIAKVLGKVHGAIEEQEHLLALTAELKDSLLHQLFTLGLRGEPQKQTDLGFVPASWEITELGKVVNLFGGYAFKSEEGVKMSNTQLVRMGNLYQNKLDLKRSPIFYPDEFGKRYPRFVLHPGDLIMSLTGTSGKEDYGFTVELKPGPKTLLLNQRIARVDLISKRLTKEFLFYFLLSRKFLDHLYPTAKGMKQANLSTHAMKRLKVPIPGVDEQKEIANCFRTIDRKIELHQAKLDSLRDLFRTLLHQLMTAQIRVHDMTLNSLEGSV